MKAREEGKAALSLHKTGGFIGLVLKPLVMRFRGAGATRPRLELLERITLAPRQTLALVEAEGRRFLVATSAEGGPAFLALDSRQHQSSRRRSRVTW